MKRALAACLLALCACNPQPPKGTSAENSQPAATPTALSLHVTGQGTASQPVRFVQQRGNRVQYELKASSYESKGPQGLARAVFRDSQIVFYDRDGSTLTANAPQAVIDETSDTVTLQGGVHTRNAAGMTLDCDRLVYDRHSEMLHGRGHVVITDSKGLRATGSSVDSDISLTHTRMQ